MSPSKLRTWDLLSIRYWVDLGSNYMAPQRWVGKVLWTGWGVGWRGSEDVYEQQNTLSTDEHEETTITVDLTGIANN